MASAFATTRSPISNASRNGTPISEPSWRIPRWHRTRQRKFRNRPPLAREGFGLDRHAHAALGDHLVDGAIVVTQLPQYVARVLADPGSRPADRGRIDLKAGRRLRLPHPPDLRLIELSDDFARDNLFIVDDFASAKDRRARDVSGVQALQPFASAVLADILRHLVDARRGVDRTRRWRRKSGILGKFGIAGGPAKPLPFGVRNGTGGDVAVAGLEHEIRSIVRIGRGGLG